MRSTLAEKYFYDIPYARMGEYTGKIKCPCHYEFWRLVEEIFGDVEGKTIIDMGCGPGLKGLTLALAGAHVIMIDNSIQRLEELKANISLTECLHGKLKIDIYEHDLGKKISFLPANYADFILCYEVIEHLKDITPFVREVIRILKPGGQMFLTTPNKNVCYPCNGEKFYGELLHAHVNIFRADDLKSIFNNADFQIENLFFYRHSLMQLCCNVIHKVMKFDKYRHHLPASVCIFFNWTVFPVVNLFVRLEEKIKTKKESGKHIFLILKKGGKL